MYIICIHQITFVLVLKMNVHAVQHWKTHFYSFPGSHWKSLYFLLPNHEGLPRFKCTCQDWVGAHFFVCFEFSFFFFFFSWERGNVKLSCRRVIFAYCSLAPFCVPKGANHNLTSCCFFQWGHNAFANHSSDSSYSPKFCRNILKYAIPAGLILGTAYILPVKVRVL